MALKRLKIKGGLNMIDKLDIFYTIHSDIDTEENDYCINCNFEQFYNKINELIDKMNEIKENEVKK